MCQLIIGGLPCLDNLFVALFLSDESAAVVFRNAVHSCLCFLNQLGFALRHGHIGNRNGHGRPGGIFITNGLDIIQGNGCLGCAVYVNDLLKNLL